MTNMTQPPVTRKVVRTFFIVLSDTNHNLLQKPPLTFGLSIVTCDDLTNVQKVSGRDFEDIHLQIQLRHSVLVNKLV